MRPPRIQPDAGPFVVALGGTLRANSNTERALKIALMGAADAGARTLLIGGPELELPMYGADRGERAEAVKHLVESLRAADGVIIGSPGYHGGVSGLVKNALDYIEDLREDKNPYLHARPVGSVTTGAGWQGAVATLASLRTIVHALRGWNTPLGVAVNTMEVAFSEEGECANARVNEMLLALGREVAEVARARANYTPDASGVMITPWGISGHAPDDWF